MKFRHSSSAEGTSHSSLLYSLALGSVGVAIFSGYWFWFRSQSRVQPNLPPLSQDGSIEVYFNHDRAVEFTEPYRQKTRQGVDLAVKLITAIESAQSQIDIAVQEFQLPNIAQALAAKSQAGIKVRIILEHNYSRSLSELTAAEIEALPARSRDRYREFQKLVDIDGNGTLSQEEINQRDALAILRNAKIAILDDTADGSKGSGLMHHKFMVVDGRKVVVTSANWTMSDVYGDFRYPESEGNQNNLVQLESSELATVFTNEFNLMWGDGTPNNPSSQFKARKPARLPFEVSVGTTRVSVQFSPTSKQQAWADSSSGTIGKWLGSGTQQVDLALFVFSEPGLASILQAQSQRGVKVRGAIDRQFAYREYSSGLTLMGVDGQNICQAATTSAQPLATIGVPTLPTGDLLHHKFAIIDRHTVITGSHNWSNAANYSNDETLLVIQNNPTVAAHFDREFARLYEGVVVGLPARLKSERCG
ncbi:phospholipase D-like domain-containing protein [Chamaesiphon polymorphus]|uniref:phospholipase D n=1 Tax=Chamaesiphon polymorphus CCALA 037 TaxID=2107692 RepID=A0A2T1GJ81_9CYAN|nr:phospholipase D-like domain-containing protein [Chamaesiphon polymorphus]PSB57853.1 competence protein ComE [Chamaesiphon polymorphus CCALA 037]